MEFSEPSPNAVSSKLKYPVIIPQRRPGTKIRGFVRAYAPVLADHDIDQDTFLRFLKTFHKSSQVCYACELQLLMKWYCKLYPMGIDGLT